MFVGVGDCWWYGYYDDFYVIGVVGGFYVGVLLLLVVFV